MWLMVSDLTIHSVLLDIFLQITVLFVGLHGLPELLQVVLGPTEALPPGDAPAPLPLDGLPHDVGAVHLVQPHPGPAHPSSASSKWQHVGFSSLND